jgi:hypothetical protein
LVWLICGRYMETISQKELSGTWNITQEFDRIEVLNTTNRLIPSFYNVYFAMRWKAIADDLCSTDLETIHECADSTVLPLPSP